MEMLSTTKMTLLRKTQSLYIIIESMKQKRDRNWFQSCLSVSLWLFSHMSKFLAGQIALLASRTEYKFIFYAAVMGSVQLSILKKCKK
jgi:hypothetical protein